LVFFVLQAAENHFAWVDIDLLEDGLLAVRAAVRERNSRSRFNRALVRSLAIIRGLFRALHRGKGF